MAKLMLYTAIVECGSLQIAKEKSFVQIHLNR